MGRKPSWKEGGHSRGPSQPNQLGHCILVDNAAERDEENRAVGIGIRRIGLDSSMAANGSDSWSQQGSDCQFQAAGLYQQEDLDEFVDCER